ncbi:iron ABC transporter permease [Macrococcus hajekii]|uniref:Probable heme-iron transport system permease protein IsdF n=1 Tax=Macrococcus hajekii TaxID=198482 RepID=A0A4R6BJN8_9STAP|nr:iron ABC transporter permease [Macrococcus hajekii]TDM01878.1 iron ABC transporter permease [Macrococcus hajekii]GGB08228.1 iron ABC transporter permease [Macrococcus hajekii]
MIEAHRKRKQWLSVTVLCVVVLLTMAFSMTTGDFKMTIPQFFRILFGMGESTDTMILYEFRMPRLIVTLLSGAALALSGALLQSITRNPLADPGIIGINAGSGFFIVLLMIFLPVDSQTFVYVLPLFSMIGGLLTALIIFILSYKKNEGIQPVRMVLMGIGMATALSGASIMMTSTFKKEQMEFVASWYAGSIWGDTWPFAIILIISVFILVPLVFAKANTLNILNTHEHISIGVGVAVSRQRLLLIAIAVFLSSSAVAVSGGIAFIGLLGPHIARGLVGPRHQMFLPIALLIGAILLALSDTIGRILLQPSGVPAGIIVSLIGAPYFIYLMNKNARDA